MRLTVGPCQDGDMSQLFAATYKDADGSQKENLMPLFWATSAYVGNGVMGLRVQAESASDGVFQLLVSNSMVCIGNTALRYDFLSFAWQAPGANANLRFFVARQQQRRPWRSPSSHRILPSAHECTTDCAASPRNDPTASVRWSSNRERHRQDWQRSL